MAAVHFVGQGRRSRSSQSLDSYLDAPQEVAEAGEGFANGWRCLCAEDEAWVHFVWRRRDCRKSGDVFFLDEAVDRQLHQYFELDEITTGQMYDSRKAPSRDEVKAMSKIKESIKVVDGTYEVGVP